MKFLCYILFLSLFAAAGFSQWNSNTGVNTLVCDTIGEQSVTKLALCPDGTTYYSWFDSRGGSYAVYLQRLDASGVRMFPAAAVLVSGNPQNSSLVDWDMIADNNNNAIITFTDIRNGGAINPFAYMVSPAGTMMWGANGVTLSDSVNAFQPNPRVVQTSDGNYVFIWRAGSGPQKFAMQKLNSAGVKQWGAGPIYFSSGTAENYDWPALVASDSGSVIIYWAGYTGTFLVAANYKLFTQKISSSGTRVWNGTQDTVYSLGRVGGFYQPRIFSDGNNGAIYCWRDDRNTTGVSTGFLQRKTSAGAFLFPVNGSAVSTLAGNNHFDPVAAYMPATGETVAFFAETNGGQTQVGFYGQKFSSNGTQMWGSSGIAYLPLGSNQAGVYSVLVRDTNAICYYNETQTLGNNLIKAFRVGKSGGYIWSGNILTASSILSPKIRLNAVINASGMSIISWQDRRSDNGGVYAQNINFDGTFGPFLGVININNGTPKNYELMQNYPNPFNPETRIRYSITSAVNVKITVYDVLGNAVKSLLNEKQNAGTYEAVFDASQFSSGVYFYKIEAGTFTDTKRMILIK
jgi:hypothetical protein